MESSNTVQHHDPGPSPVSPGRAHAQYGEYLYNHAPVSFPYSPPSDQQNGTPGFNLDTFLPSLALALDNLNDRIGERLDKVDLANERTNGRLCAIEQSNDLPPRQSPNGCTDERIDKLHQSMQSMLEQATALHMKAAQCTIGRIEKVERALGALVSFQENTKVLERLEHIESVMGRLERIEFAVQELKESVNDPEASHVIRHEVGTNTSSRLHAREMVDVAIGPFTLETVDASTDVYTPQSRDVAMDGTTPALVDAPIQVCATSSISPEHSDRAVDTRRFTILPLPRFGTGGVTKRSETEQLEMAPAELTPERIDGGSHSSTSSISNSPNKRVLSLSAEDDIHKEKQVDMIGGNTLTTLVTSCSVLEEREIVETLGAGHDNGGASEITTSQEAPSGDQISKTSTSSNRVSPSSASLAVAESSTTVVLSPARSSGETLTLTPPTSKPVRSPILPFAQNLRRNINIASPVLPVPITPKSAMSVTPAKRPRAISVSSDSSLSSLTTSAPHSQARIEQVSPAKVIKVSSSSPSLSAATAITRGHGCGCGRPRGRNRGGSVSSSKPQKKRKTESDLVMTLNSLQAGSSVDKARAHTQSGGRKSEWDTAGANASKGQSTAQRRADNALYEWPKKRPEVSSQEFVQCDHCDAWYHLGCVGLKENDPCLDPDANFYCPPCITSNPERERQRINALHEASCSRPDCDHPGKPKEFFIERFIGRRPQDPDSGGHHDFLWLVKWDGYKTLESTWTLPSQLGNCAKHIEDFKAVATIEGHELSDWTAVVVLNEAAAVGW